MTNFEKACENINTFQFFIYQIKRGVSPCCTPDINKCKSYLSECTLCERDWLNKEYDENDSFWTDTGCWDEIVKRTATDFKEVDGSKRKTNFEKIQSMSEEELSTKALDSQIDNDPVLKRLEERIKNSLSALTMVNSDYSPEAFAGRMEAIRIGDTFYGADEKRVDPLHFHEEADELMLEFLKHLGYDEGCRIFEENPKWYS